MLNDAQQAVYLALRERFVQGLAERWQALCRARRGAEAADVLHRLAGAAGSFGLDELGRVARRAEVCETSADAGARDQAWRDLHAELLRVVPAGHALPFPPPQDTVS